MRKLLLTFATLSLLLLAAHFLRYGEWGLCFAIVSLIALTFYRLAWVRWIVIAVLAIGVMVWADTGMNLINMRMAFGQPWDRLGLIIGSVIVLTAVAGSMLLTENGKNHFNRDTELAVPLAIIFMFSTLTLALARQMASLPILLTDRFFPGWGWLQILLLGIYATWVGKKMLGTAKTSRIRSKIWGFFSLVFFTILYPSLQPIDDPRR